MVEFLSNTHAPPAHQPQSLEQALRTDDKITLLFLLLFFTILSLSFIVIYLAFVL